MGRGLGNGGAAWEGPPEPRSPTRPGSRPRPRPRRPPLRPPSPHGLRYLPVHCRTGQSFAPKNRATQPASHTSGRENGGQGPTEIAEGAGAHGAARGGGKSRARGRPAAGDERRGTGTGGVGASAVGCLRLPARLLPPSETCLLQWLAGRPGFPSVGGLRGDSLPPAPWMPQAGPDCNAAPRPLPLFPPSCITSTHRGQIPGSARWPFTRSALEKKTL